MWIQSSNFKSLVHNVGLIIPTLCIEDFEVCIIKVKITILWYGHSIRWYTLRNTDMLLLHIYSENA